jgi:septal ring factor EnvC (AmiA/AmiB activator)
MKRIKGLAILIVFFLLASALPAQNSSKLRQLRNQQAQLQKKIKQSEQQLRSTNRNVKLSLSNLALLNGEIDKQEKAIHDIQFQIDSITHHVNKLSNELGVLSKQLADKKQKYRRSMMYLFSNRKSQNKLLFILSAENFTQMVRRYNYVREYAKYQRVQGMLIHRKELQVAGVQQKLLQTKDERNHVLGKQQVEKGKLVVKQTEQQKTVKDLQSKQKQVQSVLSSNKKQMAQLSSKIDYYVRLAIEQERKRREEADRKRREAEARERARREAEAAEQARAQSQNKNTEKSSSSKREQAHTEAKSEPMPEYQESNKEYKLSQNFEANRGRLPVPITGSYVISAHYGSYSMNGLSGVRLDNKGVNLTSRGGASARAIFDGEVSAVFSFGGLMNVLVRHGSYISVYCNLSSVSVSRGQHVSTRQTLGSVARDASGNCTLHFQLRKETAVLNPESWLAR